MASALPAHSSEKLQLSHKNDDLETAATAARDRSLAAVNKGKAQEASD